MSRLVRTYKEARKPLPTFSDDEYVNFCVTEAIIAKVKIEDAETLKKAQDEERRREWKRGKPGSGMPGSIQENSFETG